MTAPTRIAGAPDVEEFDNEWGEEPPADFEGIRNPDPAAERLAALRALLVDSSGLDAIPEPVPLVTDVLYRDSLVWLFGAPGSGKSFVSIDIAGCVATGESWQGFLPTVPGSVLYLVAEGVSGIRKRVRAWETNMGTRMDGVHFLPVAVQASKSNDWSVLVDLAVEMRPALVVIDTQARVTVGMEENSAKEMGEFVNRVDQLRRATGACILVVHHTGRAGEHMRGSIAMDGAADTLIRVEKSGMVVTIKCDKQKNSDEFRKLTLSMVQTAESVVLKTSDNSNESAVQLAKWLTDWWEIHRDEPISISTLVKSNVTSEATFHRSKVRLLDAGVLERSGVGSATRYRLPSDPASRWNSHL